MRRISGKDRGERPRIDALLRAVVVATAMIFVFVPGADAAKLRIASWNVLQLGWDNGKDYTALAEVAQHFDLVALQEVMSEDGAARMEQAVEARTGEAWSVLSSHLIGRGSYREMYSFMWRDSAVRFVDGAVVYLDSRDVFAREPFSARFESTDGTLRFILASIHSIYGDSASRRQAEAEALRNYWLWLEDSFDGSDPILLVGDFNLPPDDSAWGRLHDLATPMITEGATTLSSRNGRYANLYDNIWVTDAQPVHAAGSGILRYPQDVLGITHAVARDRVSDHAPVWIVLDSDVPAVSFADAPNVAGVAVTRPDPPAAGQAPVLGNRNSLIYHWPGCPGYDRISERNRVPFESRDAAGKAGYRPARNC